MFFSIIIPTRERTELLKRAIDSICTNTSQKNQVEAIVVYNLIDTQTAETLLSLSEKYKFVVHHAVDSSNMLIRDYVNVGYKLCRGDFIIVAHDDCCFTSNWDAIAASKIEQFLQNRPDGILYGKTNDDLDSHEESFTCFPIVSKKAVDALGYVMNPDFPYRGAELHLWRLFYSIDRVVDLSSVLIEHYTYHNGKRERDDLNDYVDQFMGNLPYNPLDCNVSGDLDKLRAKLY